MINKLHQIILFLKNNHKAQLFILALIPILIFITQSAYSAEPTLFIKEQTETRIFSRSELLSRKDVTPIQVEQDPAYSGKSMTYMAVPLTALLSNISSPDEISLEFKCEDGFSAPLSVKHALNTSKEKSRAYIAVENPEKPWPVLERFKNSDTPLTAGPFYLIWDHPKLSQISREEWPFQLAGFEIKPSLKVLYPALFPDPKLKPDHPINLGFQSFQKNCFACHTLNLQGQAHMGPDLNIPMNPTEYFKEGMIQKLIRNPQNLRHWKESKMTGFPEKDLSTQDIEYIVQYLKHMSHRKVK